MLLGQKLQPTFNLSLFTFHFSLKKLYFKGMYFAEKFIKIYMQVHLLVKTLELFQVPLFEGLD